MWSKVTVDLALGILGVAVEHCTCVSEARLAVGVPNGHPTLCTQCVEPIDVLHHCCFIGQCDSA